MPNSLTSDPLFLTGIVLLGLVIIASLIRWTLTRHHASAPHDEHTLGDAAPPAWHHPPHLHRSPLGRYKGFRSMQTICLILIIVGLILVVHQQYQFATGTRTSSIPDAEVLILLFVILFQYVESSRKLKELGNSKPPSDTTLTS